MLTYAMIRHNLFSIERQEPQQEIEMKSKLAGKFVMVTTKHRGVFGGTLESYDGEIAVFSNCRMCVRWAGTNGLLGLCGEGPNASCRISKAAPTAEVFDVTGIWECTDTAKAQWESEPWS